MKTTSTILKTLLVSTALLGASVASSQTRATASSSGNGATSTIAVSTVNGQSTVTLDGQQVYSGPTTGRVRNYGYTTNGTDYKALYDGDTLLWENIQGAGKWLRSLPGNAAGNTVGSTATSISTNTSVSIAQGGGARAGSGGVQAFASGVPAGSGRTSSASIGTQTVNGNTVVIYGGQEFPVGQTKGTVSAKARSVNGKDYAAAFDGDRVIWENVPGAAGQLK